MEHLWFPDNSLQSSVEIFAGISSLDKTHNLSLDSSGFYNLHPPCPAASLALLFREASC